MTNNKKIKICGIKSPKSVSVLNSVLPDYIGFVFANSSRRISNRMAQKISALLDKRIKKVGVFVNAELNDIKYLCDNDIIDVVQLHGSENENYITKLKTLTDKTIVKAIKVNQNGDILSPLNNKVDAYLFDTFVAKGFGGSGQAFSWDKIDFSLIDKPIFLAGGINLSNISKAIELKGVYCIDVSSGVETLKNKDDKKIMKIMGIVRK